MPCDCMRILLPLRHSRPARQESRRLEVGLSPALTSLPLPRESAAISSLARDCVERQDPPPALWTPFPTRSSRSTPTVKSPTSTLACSPGSAGRPQALLGQPVEKLLWSLPPIHRPCQEASIGGASDRDTHRVASKAWNQAGVLDPGRASNDLSRTLINSRPVTSKLKPTPASLACF